MSVRTLRYNTMNQHITKSALASTDRDALAFLEAAQIYNTNQQRAIVNLVRSLKRVGLWSKMKAIYPFIGGTASSHKWNLKDPRDADAAFRLTFSGGWTHNSNGITGNGTSGYADTYYNPTNNLSDINSSALTIYCRTQTGNNSVDIGVSDVYPWDIEIIYSNTFYAGLMNATYISKSNTDARGLWTNSRTASNAVSVYKNSSLFSSDTSANTTKPNCNVSIGARIAETRVAYYSNRNYAFATIGDGLTDTDATNLYNIVDLYQKRLGRAV